MKETAMNRTRQTLIEGLLLLSLAIFQPSLASADGTSDLFINPAAGATISVRGSYRLVSDVTMTASVVAITISANDVTLDLGGHTITGQAGNNKVAISGAGAAGVTVMNGAITVCGGSAIALFDNAVIRGVRVSGATLAATTNLIQTGKDSVVEGCVVRTAVASSGDLTGMNVGANCRVIGNIISNNSASTGGFTGIFTGNGCLIDGNTVESNASVSSGGSFGIRLGSRCNVRGNAVTNNSNTGAGAITGILSGDGGLIIQNNCSNNTTGSAGSEGFAIGISASGSASILDKVCSGNAARAGSNASARGISGGSSCLIRGNNCAENLAAGTGTSAGIAASFACRVEGNHVRSHGGGAKDWGINIGGSENVVIGNDSQNHQTSGMFFPSAFPNNRSQSNLISGVAIYDVTGGGAIPISVGVGDLIDVLY